MTSTEFETAFKDLTDHSPFPWQWELYQRFARGDFPESCNLPTGLGKTSVVAIWLIARIHHPDIVPTRLVYVVNRRTVVDQTTTEVEKLRANLPKLKSNLDELAISTLRGQFADNRKWSADPSRPAVICGTVDMIGSRLLFSGYGVGFKGRPLHAGFLGQDVLLIHDEAHLEPAFQELLIAIKKEQTKCNEFYKFHVVELSATSRRDNGAFILTDADKKNETVAKRIHAAKAITFFPMEDEKRQLAEKIVELALVHKETKRPILIFVRTVEAVTNIVAALGKAKQEVQQLTGTLRGLERSQMADPREKEGCPIFARFLQRPKENAPENEQWKVTPTPGTVYLVCTSAGEVGVNISADHLVCDLSSFESMAQRFGRVNRFGEHKDTKVDIIHPNTFKPDDDIDSPREKTLNLLRTLNGDGSPAALGELNLDQRLSAFSTQPVILPVSDILFDTWTLTSIRDKIPGRPPVSEYLHGVSEWEPPQTKVAWREEVDVIVGDLKDKFQPRELLDKYPIKPHELLADQTNRVLKELMKIAARHPDKPVWIMDDQGDVAVIDHLTIIAELPQKDAEALIAGKTVVLPHYVGGLKKGMLVGEYPTPSEPDVEPQPCNDDVSGVQSDEKGRKLRLRIWTDDENFDSRSVGMRIILRIELATPADDEDAATRIWKWFELPRSAENSRNAIAPVLWEIHTGDVTNLARQIVSRLKLDPAIKSAIILAAMFHDHGKRREFWQRSIGRPVLLEEIWFGKSGRKWKTRDVTGYRHEFGSLVELEAESKFLELDAGSKDLVRHLIAAHHGQARPHFTVEQTIDPSSTTLVCDAIAMEVPRIFARLQRKFGRWGLAYLESILRAADWAASAEPSSFFEEASNG